MFHSKSDYIIHTISILLVSVLFGLTIYIIRPKSIKLVYMAEIDGINYSVEYCNLKANVLTYTKDDLTINQICTDCKCQVRIADDN